MPRGRYSNGAKFCKECHLWISRADIPYQTYLDNSGGMRCKACHFKVRHQRKQKHHISDGVSTPKTIMEKILRLVFLFSALSTVATISIALANPVYASTLSKEPPSIVLNGGMVNLSADQEDIDIDIDPTDPLPANGTQVISTAGATDMDINEFPPQGVKVIIENETVTVTNHPVNVQ